MTNLILYKPIIGVRNPPIRCAERPVPKKKTKKAGLNLDYGLFCAQCDILGSTVIYPPPNEIPRFTVMTSPYSISPDVQTFAEEKRSTTSPRSASPISCYGSSPERVTRQNQLLQPVMLLAKASRASSEVNLTDKEECSVSDSCSRSENAYAQIESVPQEITQLKDANSKRMGWVKLIRLQLNALHERKMKNLTSKPSDTKISETDSTEPSLVRLFISTIC